MTFRLPSERVTVTVENGPSIEVERLVAWPLAWTALALVSAFYAARTAKKPSEQMAALRNVGQFFVTEAQPVWDIADHRGPVLPTVEGFMRLDPTISLALVYGWLETQQEKASAVDEMVPPGEAREELKRRLKASRAA